MVEGLVETDIQVQPESPDVSYAILGPSRVLKIPASEHILLEIANPYNYSINTNCYVEMRRIHEYRSRRHRADPFGHLVTQIVTPSLGISDLIADNARRAALRHDSSDSEPNQ